MERQGEQRSDGDTSQSKSLPRIRLDVQLKETLRARAFVYYYSLIAAAVAAFVTTAACWHSDENDFLVLKFE